MHTRTRFSQAQQHKLNSFGSVWIPFFEDVVRKKATRLLDSLLPIIGTSRLFPSHAKARRGRVSFGNRAFR